jgi:exodeoxyribonuclease V alpha subunit
MDNSPYEKLLGIVDRITFHNEQSGWSVLKVLSFRDPGKIVTVLIHQEKVFAGATMEFRGHWTHHTKFGDQFKAIQAIEKKPATTAALEKYLGSGLIRGVGPPTAKRIVKYFKEETLTIFEENINELLNVPGIARKKLEMIKASWHEHRSIRDVMMFLQGHGLSTLYAVKIYRTYQDKSIEVVSNNPYRLAHDIYGIGFFTADKIALNIGLLRTSVIRLEAAIKHVLQASREEGHCYLTQEQIVKAVMELLQEKSIEALILEILEELLKKQEIRLRILNDQHCYYSKSLYYDELSVANKIKELLSVDFKTDEQRIKKWVMHFCQNQSLQLSTEQQAAVCEIAGKSFSILTGGPGCGKTTTTKVLVKLLQAMNRKIMLAAPTGRATQRMSEVIGLEAKTIHRLLHWSPVLNSFQHDEKNPLETDFLIIDESSMLDISLAARLLKAVPAKAQVLFIGDPDQLPAVGAGNVLRDLINTPTIPTYRLNQIFRQARASEIIRFAHQINSGSIPQIVSPVIKPGAFKHGHDCLFFDSEEATQDQLRFLARARSFLQSAKVQDHPHYIKYQQYISALKKSEVGLELEVEKAIYPEEELTSPLQDVLVVPDKFKHVDFNILSRARDHVDELFGVMEKVHPWSTLHYGLTALDTTLRLYTKTVNEWMGKEAEIQVLCPQLRGSLGTISLNQNIQVLKNPPSPGKTEYKLGEKIFRTGDRVIQTKNNYDLGVFNGDIGKISYINNLEGIIEVSFDGSENRSVRYSRDALSELALAYAITIHKSQGSEFEVVIIPVLGQHFNMLFRNLIYTGLTRAKKLAILVGSRKALALAVGKQDQNQRQTALADLLGNF